MTSDRSGRASGAVGEDRPAPAWVGDVHLGVEAWTGSSGSEQVADTSTRPVGSRDRRPRSQPGPGARSTPPVEKVAQGPAVDPESAARKILLDALTGQARSRKELSDKLAKKDVPTEVAQRLLDRFEEVGLVDDEAFARAWIASRQPGKGLARRALAQELRRKGIVDEVAREALDEIDPDDEEAAARVLVRKKLRSLHGVDQQKATRRLVGMLARKGYGAGMAFAIVKDELLLQGAAELDDPDAGLDEEP